jgi:hypothetical protein
MRRPFFGPRTLSASPEAGENGVGWAHLASGIAPAAAPGSDPAIRSLARCKICWRASAVDSTTTVSVLTR